MYKTLSTNDGGGEGRGSGGSRQKMDDLFTICLSIFVSLTRKFSRKYDFLQIIIYSFHKLVYSYVLLLVIVFNT